MNARYCLQFTAMVIIVGCNKAVVDKRSNMNRAEYAFVSVSPLVAKPGDTLSLVGKNLQPGRTYLARFATNDGITKDASIKIASDSAASFEMVSGLGLGQKDFKIESENNVVGEFSIMANDLNNSLPFITAAANEICSTTTYIDKNGKKKKGTADCGETSTSTDLSKLTAANIKAGVTIGGVTGAYPSVTYPLQDADGTADLDAATFNAKVKSSTAFEYWTSAGVRQTGAGDDDIVDTNIKNSVSVFGTTGTYTGTEPDAWDLRVGVTVGSTTGKLKVNCRNRARTAVYNYDGAGGSPSAIPNTAVATGTTFEYWDTIEDYNSGVAGLPTDVITGWNNFDCGGVETTSGDNNVWKDVTTTGDGITASSCAATSAHCTMKDKITGIHWSAFQNASQNWSTAINTCDSLSHNGATDWRLPTQKELMEANAHGIRSASATDWITDAEIGANWFWSATSVSYLTDNAWYVYLSSGSTGYGSKASPFQVVCVR